MAVNRWILIALTASLGLAACTKKEEPAAPVAAAPAEQAAAPAQAANTGTVMQTIEGGGYTYAQVDVGGQVVWIAGAEIDVKPGDGVQWGDHMIMHNFHAKSIDRMFDEILFVSAWGPTGGSMAEVAPHGTPGGASGGHPPMGQQGVAGEHAGEVKSVTTAGGYSYMEVAQGDATVWIAVPEVAVQAGDTVTWDGGMTMRNFEAKSINRTFPEIIFADAARVVR